MHLSIGAIMAISFGGLAVAYITASIVLLKFPNIFHKKRSRAFYAAHISHRGGAGERIENTMPAFKRAVELGTDMLEIDCHITSDHQVVVCHDDNLLRTTGIDINVSRCSFSLLPLLKQTLDVTFQPGSQTTALTEDERKIVLLIDVFEQFPDIPINIDVKINNDELISEINKLILKYDREHLTVWGNFRDEICQKLYSVNPNIALIFSIRQTIKTVILFYIGLLPFFPLKESYLEIPLLQIFKRASDDWKFRLLLPIVNKMLLRPSLYNHLKKRGIPTFLWVCNSEEHFHTSFKAGAEGVMTDYPTKLRDFLKSNGHKYLDGNALETMPIVRKKYAFVSSKIGDNDDEFIK